jgi:hypothetical protein
VLDRLRGGEQAGVERRLALVFLRDLLPFLRNSVRIVTLRIVAETSTD